MANALIGTRDEPFETYHLGFSYCPGCTHGQLTTFVEPEVIFSHYLYSSGTSGTLRSFFDWFARSLKQSVTTKPRLLEIASNDGSLLDCLRQQGFDVAGIDPARNLCEVAEAKGHDVQCGYFPDVSPSEPVDIIVAMNVMAHNPDPLRFMQAVAGSLSDDGVALIQTSQANMLVNGEFDTIYHEHYSFFTVTSMARLATLSGLELVDVQLVSVHGTSFLFKLRKKGSSATLPFFTEVDGLDFTVLPSAGLQGLFTQELDAGTAKSVYEKFIDDANKTISETAELIARFRNDGFRIGLLGVAAKSLTFIRAAGIEPDFYVDEAALKIGRFVPGASSPIMSLQDLASAEGKLCLIIGAWNFADELSQKVYKLFANEPRSEALELITYFPTLRRLSR